VSPRAVLAVGLKVDVDALPAGLVSALRAGSVNLDELEWPGKLGQGTVTPETTE
jgi:hypothetical protein